MHKIRILGIMPYPEMKDLAEELAAERSDIELDAYVGDYRDCVEILEANLEKNYEIILSRGGTAAELMRRIRHIPIVDISVSTFDILRALRLAESSGLRYTVIGFSGLVAKVRALCELQQLSVPCYVSESEQETRACITQLKQDGISLVLGGVITNLCALQAGSSSILITSGRESIEGAFDQAVRFSEYYRHMESELFFYKNILHSHRSFSMIVGEEGNILFSTANYTLSKEMLAKSRKEVSLTLKYGRCAFFKTIGDIQYSIRCTREDFSGQPCCSFEFEPTHIPVRIDRYGISYTDCTAVEKELLSSNILSFLDENDRRELDALTRSSAPVLISGEAYCYKSIVAKYLYCHGKLRRSPLICIDCGSLETKGWHFLVDKEDSPLHENGCTVLIDNIHYLDETRRQYLLTYMMNNLFCKRNRVMFVYTLSEDAGEQAFISHLLHELHCLTFAVPPLRKRLRQLDAYLSMYLSGKNQGSAEPVFRMEPEAMRSLREYDWKFNYKQLERVLEKLYYLAEGGSIGQDVVFSVLREERELYGSTVGDAGATGVETDDMGMYGGAGSGTDRSADNPGINSGRARSEKYVRYSEKNVVTLAEKTTAGGGFDDGDEIRPNQLSLSDSLDAINRTIVRLVLDKYDGNQTAAAKSLGISRTTMWRMLK